MKKQPFSQPHHADTVLKCAATTVTQPGENKSKDYKAGNYILTIKQQAQKSKTFETGYAKRPISFSRSFGTASLIYKPFISFPSFILSSG